MPSTTAHPGVATATGTVLGGTPYLVPQWNLCSASAMPTYILGIDWNQAGFTAAGGLISANPYMVFDASGWLGFNCSLQWTKNAPSQPAVPCTLVTPNGTSATGGMEASVLTGVGSVVPGQSYVADCRVLSPVASWTTLFVAVDWHNAAGTYLSTSVAGTGTVPAGAWTRLVQTYTAPANASQAIVRTEHSGTPPSSMTYYTYGLMLLDPTLPAVMNSIRPANFPLPDLLGSSGITYSYGRDTYRQTTPASLGTGAFSLNNTARTYSPERSDSPLFGTLDAARTVSLQTLWNGSVTDILHGRINNYTVNVDWSNRTVDFTISDDEQFWTNNLITTPLYRGIRTGDAINYILDAVGWTGPTSIDPGVSYLPYWWLTAYAAGNAINDIVQSEGPPSIAYVAPDGTFTFRDRSHRALYAASQNVQGSFYTPEIMNPPGCGTPPTTSLTFTPPFTYDHGWLAILNSVQFSVTQRAPTGVLTAVWSSTDTITVTPGTPYVLTVTTSDPFTGAITPVSATDYTKTGSGTVSVSLSQTSGGAATITYTASGSAVQLTGLQLRAYPIPVTETLSVVYQDLTSIGEHGEQDYQNPCPWAGLWDAQAIAELIVRRYAQRVPTISMRLVSGDPGHYTQVINRTISDLVAIQNDELGSDNTYYIENVAHTIERMNQFGVPPVHAVVLACEQQNEDATYNNPASVFIFNSATNGLFNTNVFGL